MPCPALQMISYANDNSCLNNNALISQCAVHKFQGGPGTTLRRRLIKALSQQFDNCISNNNTFGGLVKSPGFAWTRKALTHSEFCFKMALLKFKSLKLDIALTDASKRLQPSKAINN